MIPFASQRGLGQDLATHLLNAQDNEYVELAEVSGAIAPDLHGAFAEWEALAHNLTKCQNYLYSLSINPDPRQDPLTRDQYLEYIGRIEDRLGLTGQPRAVVFHIKHDREHCHVIWSRVDAENEKAVHMAFDHDKLMMVTREFARDHDLTLPAGYYKDGRGEQLSLYEMHQRRTTGLDKEEHQEMVTDAWRASDSPKAFVAALAANGYMLARGNRPYVLVDFYGNTHSLPRLINDKTIRTKDIRAFLEKDYPAEDLPGVDEAKALIAKHRKAIEGHQKAEQEADAKAELKRRQKDRRDKMETERKALRQTHHAEREKQALTHRGQRDSLRAAYVIRMRQLREERRRREPTGLAAFLGRVSGVSLIRKNVRKHQDRKRWEAHLEKREEIRARQAAERQTLSRRQEMESLDLARKLRSLEAVEKRERKALEENLRRQVRVRSRGGKGRMPSLTLDLKPPGRPAAPHKAMNRYTSELARSRFNEAQAGKAAPPKRVDLSREFEQAAGSGEKEGAGSNTGAGSAPRNVSRPAPRPSRSAPRRGRNRDDGPDRGR